MSIPRTSKMRLSEQNLSTRLSFQSFLDAHKTYMKPSSSRSYSEPTLIDTQCISIIGKNTSIKIFNLMKNKGLIKHQRIMTPQKVRHLSETKPTKNQTKIFLSSYHNQHNKFIKLIQKEHNRKEELKKKLGLKSASKKQEEEIIDKARITYFQKKFNSQICEGKYGQKMHPLCFYYEREADRYLRHRLKLAKNREEL